MKTTVLVIHGGNTYNTYEEYISSLSSKTVDLDRLRYGLGWKDTITSDLGDNYDVFLPSMPNSSNAQYNEWKIWFEKVLAAMPQKLILVGHSMGGIFLAKYLSENTINNEILALFLVAAPYTSTPEENLASFELGNNFSSLNNASENIVLYHSQDDEVVPIADLYEYLKQLPNAEAVTFNDRGHFLQEHFPELVEKIKHLS
jgi:predicted alpha/beta hydrolase family esterase